MTVDAEGGNQGTKRALFSSPGKIKLKLGDGQTKKAKGEGAETERETTRGQETRGGKANWGRRGEAVTKRSG